MSRPASRSYFTIRIASSRLAIALTLVGLSRIDVLHSRADEPNKASTADGMTAPPTWIRDAARQLWPMLDMIDRYHVSPPARIEMFGPALLALNGEVVSTQLGNLPFLGLDGFITTIPELLRHWQTDPKDPEVLRAAQRLAAATTPDDAAVILAEFIAARPSQELPKNAALYFQQTVLAAAHCQFESAHEHEVAEQIQADRYVGIGIQTGYDGQRKAVSVANVLPNGPASAVGLGFGDVIVMIDGLDVRGRTMAETLPILRGEEGSEVEIGVLRPGAKELLSFSIVRRVIPLPSIQLTHLSDEGHDLGIALITIQALRSSTLHELRQMDAILAERGSRGLILDFRYGPYGGSLHNALLMADGLLTSGELAISMDRKDQKRIWTADAQAIFRDLPMVVIVSSSVHAPLGALIMALQDNHRATVIGQRIGCEAWLPQAMELPDNLGVLNVPTRQLLPLHVSRKTKPFRFKAAQGRFIITPDEVMDTGDQFPLDNNNTIPARPDIPIQDVRNNAMKRAIEILTAPRKSQAADPVSTGGPASTAAAEARSRSNLAGLGIGVVCMLWVAVVVAWAQWTPCKRQRKTVPVVVRRQWVPRSVLQ